MDFSSIPKSALICDGVALILILIFTISGIKKGFVNSIISVFGKLFSFILAIILCSSVAVLIENNFTWYADLSSSLSTSLSSVFGEELMNTPIEQAGNILEGDFNLKLFIVKLAVDKFGGDYSQGATLSTIICPLIAHYIFCILSAILLVIVIRIVLKIVCAIVNKMRSNKIVAILDSSLGLIYGLIKSVVIINIVLLIFGIIPINAIKEISSASFIDSTIIIKYSKLILGL